MVWLCKIDNRCSYTSTTITTTITTNSSTTTTTTTTSTTNPNSDSTLCFLLELIYFK